MIGIQTYILYGVKAWPLYIEDYAALSIT